jgi:hypothetical protein
MHKDMDMNKETLKEKIERLKLKAELFLKENNPVFMIDIYNNYYFCDILFVGENYLVVQGFEGIRKGEKDRILWADVIKLEEYKKKRGENDLSKM